MTGPGQESDLKALVDGGVQNSKVGEAPLPISHHPVTLASRPRDVGRAAAVLRGSHSCSDDASATILVARTVRRAHAEGRPASAKRASEGAERTQPVTALAAARSSQSTWEREAAGEVSSELPLANGHEATVHCAL